MSDPADPLEPGDDDRTGPSDDADGDHAHGSAVPHDAGRWPSGPGDRVGPVGWWGALRDEFSDRVTAFGGGGLRLALAGAAVVALALAGWWLLRPGPAPAESALPAIDAVAPTTAAPPSGDDVAPTSVAGDATATGGTPPSAGDGEVTAHAAGAVANPGVYRLAGGARVADLVDAAGGLAPEADVDRLNLAAPVTDGARVYVPARGEQEVPEVAGLPEAPPSGGGGAPGSGPGTGGEPGPAAPVDLNAASATELEVLPGIGPATSAAVIEYRTTNGGFSSVDELIEVSGIGDAKMATLRDLVTV